MKKLIISSQGRGVEVVSNSISLETVINDIENNPLLGKFIPDFSFGDLAQNTLVVEDVQEVQVHLSPSDSKITGRYGVDFSSTDIIVLAEYLLERLRQEKHICTIHSTSVYKGNDGIVLFANLTGAGKTSTAISLGTKYGFKLYSDDKTQIDIQNFKLCGQTKRFVLEEKTKELVSSEKHEIEATNKKDIKLFVIPVINESASKVVVRRYTPAQLKWSLYEELSKDIRLINGMVFNMTKPLPSLDTEKLSQQRLSFVSEISNSIPCYFIQGTLEQITEEVNQIFSKISAS